ncbi:rho GTPase-activating protein 26 isoform X5 [Latimeria chalumnae]|uniref:rho GTPase-activating protein 26 isoform X5 n=1 Tax=Latimeria chalumnae TaxID=7897 RepID=UPI0006D91E42|nr:PREDICTED: rho GTPase-activating protein 26 isoform X5 [Latimeria chalumnae]|eukprot:XP_014343933.1 PREDICTED: rho GTPase-activating protein 26 isoform X5 [Latimeria chalumnae]
MGLPALEFSDCYLDSPQFRERLKSHEAELDKTNKFIKELIKDGKALITALKHLSLAKRKFAESLNEFKFQCIGDAETDDEICIAKSLQEFAGVLKNLEDERVRMIENASEVLITPLEKFRKEQIGAAKDAKKKYDKETEKYCTVLEKHLSLSSKKKESHLHEADSQVDLVRQHFYEVSLEYVFKVQEVQERKMFDFVEPILAFLQGLFTFYHHGYELAKDFSHFKTELTISIQNTRDRFEGTRSEVESLMKKMKENPQEHVNISPFTMEGYLYIQEKRPFGSTWTKHYCMYQKESKRLGMVPFEQKSGGKVGEEETFILASCTRRKTESIEKRFCFDVEGVERPGVITMQALSEEDRRLWMEAMDGREPVYNLNRDSQSEATAQLDNIGFSFIRKCIHAVETRGINEQGLYRIVGVNSKVQKLLNALIDPKTASEVDLENTEWEIKTITSALKHYLRMLPAPLMTYQFQRSFIKAAKLDNQESRISEIHTVIHRLPEKNQQMLHLLMTHLANVANNHKQNLMTVANLGVVFGPTLLRPQEETVAAIMDIKFQNIVIEILIENHEKIFSTIPDFLPPQTNPQLNVARRRSTDCKPPSCSERPLTLFHTAPANDKQKHNSVSSSADSICPVNNSNNSQRQTLNNMNSSDPDLEVLKGNRPNSLLSPKNKSAILPSPLSPSPTSPHSPSWPMFSAPSSPMPTSSTSSDSSPLSPTFRKAKALYACKAEHDSELSFSAGTVFENVHPSQEPGWLEGTLDGRTGLIPENYVEFL